MSILEKFRGKVKDLVAKIDVYEAAIVFAQANLRGYARTLIREKLHR